MDSESTNISCPVCTLYLRPGITLKSHLGSHPKQKVIEALVRLADRPPDNCIDTIATKPTECSTITTQIIQTEQPNPQQNFLPMSNMYFYKQNSTAQQMNQYIIPTVLNGPPMMPFMYQQQVFMSSGPCITPMRSLPSTVPYETPSIVDVTEERKIQSLHHVKIIDMDSDEEPIKDSETQTIIPDYLENSENQEIFYDNQEPNDSIMSAEEIDDMQIVMMDSHGSQILSHVEDYPEGTILMSLDGVECHKDIVTTEESVSMESSNVNIRADERLPPTGELSGQESIGGTSDSWSRMHYENSSSLDSGLRPNWEDSSDIEAPVLQSRVPPFDDDQPTIIGFSGTPKAFKCPTCGESFECLKERRVHESEVHKKLNSIGSEIGKRNVRKLVIKVKTEPEVDFTNKLKVEDKREQPKVICTTCNTVLDSVKALKQHRQTVHKIESRNRCPTCNEIFANSYKFIEHLNVHPLECNICGRLFYRTQNMQLHMRRHLGIKPYKCDVCQKSFITKQKLDEHRHVHTGEAPIKCTQCDETFRRHSNLVQHRNRHHLHLKKKLKDYFCAFCNEVFHSKKKLAWHLEIHETKPKSCTACNEKFIHAASLTRHMRRAHNRSFLPEDSASVNAECPVCKGVFLKTSLEVHMRSHNGQRPYTCLICSKDFTTKWNLKLHKYTHASRVLKPFKCELCKGAFIREAEYTAHMNSHKSIRPYTCNYCGAKFIRKYNCLRHVKEHETDKLYTCNTCGKSFHRSYYLKDHMRIHSGLRPFSCNICGKTSTTKSNHNKHVMIHHAREPVSTEN